MTSNSQASLYNMPLLQLTDDPCAQSSPHEVSTEKDDPQEVTSGKVAQNLRIKSNC